MTPKTSLFLATVGLWTCSLACTVNAIPLQILTAKVDLGNGGRELIPLEGFGGTPNAEYLPLKECQGDCDSDDDVRLFVSILTNNAFQFPLLAQNCAHPCCFSCATFNSVMVPLFASSERREGKQYQDAREGKKQCPRPTFAFNRALVAQCRNQSKPISTGTVITEMIMVSPNWLGMGLIHRPTSFLFRNAKEIVIRMRM